MLASVEKPECFSEIGADHTFYKLQDDKGLYGYIALYIGPGDAVIHLDLNRFTHKTLKHMLKEFEWVKQVCKHAGCKKILALTKADMSKTGWLDTKWDRLIRLFGFPEAELIKMSTLGV